MAVTTNEEERMLVEP